MQISANTEVGLTDQVRELGLKIKALERQVHDMERQRNKVISTIEAERESTRKLTEMRLLTVAEKNLCNNTIKNLLSASKESLTILQSAATLATQTFELSAGSGDQSLSSIRSDEREAAYDASMAQAKAQADSVVRRSQEALFTVIEEMDKALLSEMGAALGGMVQNLYTEREKLKQDELTRSMRIQFRRDSIAKAEQEARQRKQQAEALVLGLSGVSLDNNVAFFDAYLPILLKGNSFLKTSRLGLQRARLVSLSKDLDKVLWCHVGNMHSPSSAFISNFCGVEISGKAKRMIILRGKRGQSSLRLEYVNGKSAEETQKIVNLWFGALNRCVEHSAQSSPTNSAFSLSSPNSWKSSRSGGNSWKAKSSLDAEDWDLPTHRAVVVGDGVGGGAGGSIKSPLSSPALLSRSAVISALDGSNIELSSRQQQACSL